MKTWISALAMLIASYAYSQYEVTNTGDSGAGSLRQAISNANGSSGETITFNASLNGQTISLTSGQIQITQPMTIDGANQGVVISAASNGSSRIFFMDVNGVVDIIGLTLEDATIGTSLISGFGGAMYLDDGDLTMTNCIIRNHSGNLAGIFTEDAGGATLTLINCLFYGNVSSASNVGAVRAEGDLVIIGCTFADNTGGNVTSVHAGRDLTIYNSIFYGNNGSDNIRVDGTLIDAENNIFELETFGTYLSCDPLFADTSGEDFTLQECSAGINGGNNSNVPGGVLTDLAGNTRTFDTTIDIGAFELQTTPTNVPEVDLTESATSIVNGGTFNFGIVTLGSTQTATFSIENSGTCDLALCANSLTGDSEFSLGSAFPAGPVGVSGSVTFDIDFDISTLGVYTSVLSFSSNDSDESTYNITISGTVVDEIFYSRSSGSFDVTTRWNTAPGGGGADAETTDFTDGTSNFIIQSGHSIGAPSSAININNLTIEASGLFEPFGQTIQINGQTQVSGTFRDSNSGGTNIFVGFFHVNSGGGMLSTFGTHEYRGGITNAGTFNTNDLTTHHFTTNSQTVTANAPISIIGEMIFDSDVIFAESSHEINVGSTGQETSIRTGVTVTNRVTNNQLNLLGFIINGPGTFTNDLNAHATIWANNVDATLVATASGNTIGYPRSDTQFILEGDYYNLYLNSSGSGTQTRHFNGTTYNIAGNLEITDTDLEGGTATINLSGNLTGSGTSSVTTPFNHLVMNGSSAQTINLTGFASFEVGQLTVNNASGAVVRSNLDVTTNNITLTSGNLTIDAATLFKPNDSQFAGGTFGPTKMVVMKNAAIIRTRTPGTDPITYPIGTGSVYTPITVTPSIYTSSAGHYLEVSVNPTEEINVLTSGVSLVKHWAVTSNGMSNITGSIGMTYDDGEIAGDESVYVPAYYDGSSWTTGVVGDVTEGSNLATYNFTGASSLNGSYTAGEASAFDPYLVTNTLDDGSTGSLRWAIANANASTNKETITFDLPGLPSTWVITTTSTITIDNVNDMGMIIDGTTQTGYGQWTDMVQIDGPDGLTGATLLLSEPNVEIYGLHFTDGRYWIQTDANADGFQIGSDSKGNVFQSSNQTGLNITGADGGFIQGNRIGTSKDGLSTAGTGASGDAIFLSSANNIQIGGDIFVGQGNLISGNGTGTHYAIDINSSPNTQISGNLIGTDVTGNNNLGNTRGINISGGTSHNTTIGNFSSGRNVISGNTGAGITVQSAVDNLMIEGNIIGLNVDADAVIGNGTGIRILALGTGSQIWFNTISGNNGGGSDGQGIYLDQFSNDLLIQNNNIGTNSSGAGTGFGNRTAGIHIRSAAGADNSNRIQILNNTISGNGTGGSTHYGIYFQKSGQDPNDILIQNNRIGVAQDGATALGNNLGGIGLATSLTDLTGVIIGGAGNENIIAHNSTDGIYFEGANSELTGLDLGLNSYFCNGDLAIDFQDPGGTDAPVIASVSTSAISGTSGSTSGSVEIFTNDASCADNQGATWVESGTINGDGTWSISTNAPYDAAATYVAYADDGSSGISEFSELATVEPFVTTWSNTSGTIVISTNAEVGNYTITWTNLDNIGVGDGSGTGTGNFTINSLDPTDRYQVEITGNFPRIYTNNGGQRDKLISIDQWGDIQWQDMTRAFYGCNNLVNNATDAPDLSQVESLSEMFRASSFNADISSWDVSNVQDMSEMFFTSTAFNNGGQPLSWGANTSAVTDMNAMFSGATAFNQAINDWDVSMVLDMSFMFQGADAFDQAMNGWIVSSVTTMDYMFNNADIFNQDVSDWDVSSVQNMELMFANTDAFNNGNQPLDWENSGNTGMVIDMRAMFSEAGAFNQDVSGWDVSLVQDMSGMFSGTDVFNNGGQPFDWGTNTGAVTNMNTMFYNTTAFNQDISGWDVSMVMDMSQMFQDADIFNNGGQPLDWANTSQVNTLRQMFSGVSSFNQDVSSWDVSGVGDMLSTFFQATAFDQSLATWTISSASNISGMLSNSGISIANYDATLIAWEAQNPPTGLSLGATGLNFCDAATARTELLTTHGWTAIADAGSNCPFITTWQATGGSITIPTAISGSTYDYDVYVENTGDASENYTLLNQTGNATFSGLIDGDQYRVEITGLFPRIVFTSSGQQDKILSIDQWGDNPWTSMQQAFLNCDNLEILASDAPDLSGVTDMSEMLYGCSSFNNDIDHWVVDNVSSMQGLFRGCSIFNQDLDSWNTANVTNMSRMFYQAFQFDGDITTWDVRMVQDMSFMFFLAGDFNQAIGNWPFSNNTGNVSTMDGMFRGASSFDQPLNNWDVSSVTNMREMFRDASAFNQDLNSWTTTMLDNLNGTFNGAIRFNGQIDNWDVDQVTTFAYMFNDATDFNQPLNSWVVTGALNMQDMFSDADAFIQDLNNWTPTSVLNMNGMFSNTALFNGNITTWDVSSVDNMGSMFLNAIAFNQPVGDWASNGNTGNVESMSFMFANANAFNQPLNGWDVSSVTNMTSMFSGTDIFNQDISSWLVNQVTGMQSMFNDATAFNQDLTSWGTRVGLVSDFRNMFLSASAFDQSLGSWDVSVAAASNNMTAMLSSSGLSIASYDATLIGWESQGLPSGVSLGAAGLMYCAGEAARTSLAWIISGDTQECPFVTTWITDDTEITIPTTGSGYNYDINWTNLTTPMAGDGFATGVTGDHLITGLTNGDTYRIEIKGTFPRIYFNSGPEADKIRTIEEWGDKAWTSMANAFFDCSNLTIPATDAPDLSGVTDMSSMLQGCTSFNNSIDHWLVDNVQDMTNLFYNCESFDQDLNSWTTSGVTSMSGTFGECYDFNGNISDWTVTAVTNFFNMFHGASSFDQPLNWTINTTPGAAINMRAMFQDTPFNQDLNTWDMSEVVNTRSMFRGTTEFNGNIDNWNVSQVTDMLAMFGDAVEFDRDLSSWLVNSVTTMRNMFANTPVYNQDLSAWHDRIGNVSDMSFMFTGTTLFNGNISNWDVSNVQNMQSMFGNALAFNQDLSGWMPDDVNTIEGMFAGAALFNQDISGWNVSNISNMRHVFSGASAFNQNLGSWDIVTVTDMTFMLSNSGLSTANYDATLIGWADDNGGTETIPTSVNLGAVGVGYCDGSLARQELIDTYSWSITGDVESCPPFLSYHSGIDISSHVTHESTYSLNSDERDPQGIVFNEDGTKLFIIGTDDDEVNQYSLSTPFETSSGVMHEGIFDVDTETTAPSDIAFSPDGMTMYILDAIGAIHQYTLSVPYDITITPGYNGSVDISSDGPYATGMAFNPNGTLLFISDRGHDEINQYIVLSSFDVLSGLTHQGQFDVSAESGEPEGVAFNKAGTKMFVAEGDGYSLIQYSLTNAFNVLSGVSLEAIYETDYYEFNPTGLAFNSAGSTMYTVGTSGREINQFQLSPSFKETLSDDGSLRGEVVIFLKNDTFTSAGGMLTNISDYTVSGVPSSLTPVMTISSDGTYAVLSFSGAADDHQIGDAIADLSITFNDGAFNTGDAANVTDAVGYSLGFGIDYLQTDYVVTNTNDSGAGSLRQAILDVQDIYNDVTISFGLTGDGSGTTWTISPTSDLPTVSNYNEFRIIIDGTTQPGWDRITDRMVVLQDASSLSVGLYLDSQVGIEIYGLKIRGFEYGISATYLENAIIGALGKANVISGNETGMYGTYANTNNISYNFIGTDVTGMSADPNNIGLDFGYSYSESYDNYFTNNVVSGNTEIGLAIDYGYDFVQDNLIGVSADESISIPNDIGLHVNGSGIIENNVISGNTTTGIYLMPPHYGNEAHIRSNFIGRNTAGDALPNGNGITSEYYDSAPSVFAPTPLIGGFLPADGNFIAYNTGAAIQLDGLAYQETKILNNSIYENGWGIELLAGADGGIDPPVITSVTPSIISGTVGDNTTGTIHIYEVDPISGNQGITPIDSATVNDFTWSVPSPPTFNLGTIYTATVTTDTYGTSEFYRPVVYNATDVTTSGFTANWEPISGATSVLIDVDDDPDFSSPLVSGQSLAAGGVDNVSVTLTPLVTYYVRIQVQMGSVFSPISDASSFMVTPGNALDFDGNEYVDFGDVPIFDGLTEVTLEGWFNTYTSPSFTASDEHYSIITKGDMSFAGSNAIGIYFRSTDGGGDLIARVGTDVDTETASYSTSNINAFQWYHVALTWTSGGNVNLYLDGTLVSSSSSTLSGSINDISGSLYFGNSDSGFENLYEGLLDEVKIWDTEKTQTDIESGLFSSLNGNESDLIGYYRFDQGIAEGDNTTPPVDVLPDRSQNNNNGALNGFILDDVFSNWVESFTVPDPFIVTNTLDDGIGSLRWCVENANASTEENTITFSNTIDGGVINLASPVTITSGNGFGTIINGDIDGDNIPSITIQRSGTGYDGLIVQAGSVQVQYLHIQGFSGSGRSGLLIDGASDVTVLGNFIGTDITGNADGLANFSGIRVEGASFSTIGDGTATGRNVIGNNSYGIYHNGSDYGIVDGNYIGVGLNGTADVGNARGIFLFTASETAIGEIGSEPNVISHNDDGVYIQNASQTIISNNYIGVDATGNAAAANGRGIWVRQNSSSTQIGYDITDAGNVISSNSIVGVLVDDSDNSIIEGNIIGLGEDGDTSLGNNGNGISINGTSTPTTINANIISANASGIHLETGDNSVTGNYIGTDETGEFDRGNSTAGISIQGGSGEIGDTGVDEGNLISGNGYGIGVGVGGYSIVANKIGTNQTGLLPIPNDNQGIRLSVGSGTTIGDGTSPGANEIAFNTLDGILVENPSTTGNSIDSNYITENGRNGILIESQANGNLIASNVIASNITNGVAIGEISVTGIDNNTLSQNLIHRNGGLGISLINGANNGISQPVITTATASSVSGTGINGQTIELFIDNSSTPPQAENYEGTAVVSAGVWSVSGSFTPSETFTATATDPSGNTSELAVLAGTAPEISVYAGADNTGAELFDNGSFDMGSEIIGNSKTQSFTIENVGSTTLTINDLTSDNPKFILGSASTSIAPSGTHTFSVTMDGANTGSFSGTISIDNDDPNESPFEFTLSGQVTAPEIDLYQGTDNTGTSITDAQVDDVDFGNAAITNDIALTFAVENTGTSTLTIASILSSTSEYTIASAPTSIAAGATETFTITLDGSATGVFNSVITINSDDGDENPFTFPVTGQITEPEIEVFQGTDNTGTSITDAQVGDVDFGNAPITNDVALTFAVENTGTSILTITSISSSTTKYTITSAPTTVGVGATETFTITLDGSATGVFNSIITINNDDLDESPFTFPVTGQITEPEIAIYDGTTNATPLIVDGQTMDVDFGSAVEGNNITRTFAIENLGTSDLNIGSVSVVGTDFTVVNGITAIASGSTETFTVTLSGSSAGTFNSTVTITSDDIDENPFTYPIAGVITKPEIEVYQGTDNTGIALADAQTGSVDFGTTMVGSDVTLDFAIVNSGSSALSVLSITSSIGEYVIAGMPTTVTAGATETFTITMDGSSAGTFNGVISISNDDLDENPFTFPVSGSVSAVPEIEVYQGSDNTGIALTDGQAGSVDFGSTTTGSDVTLDFAIVNSGSSVLTLSGITSSLTEYTISAAPTTVGVGATETFTISLDASAIGTFNGTITINNDDADENPFTFPVSGTVSLLPEPEIAIFTGSDNTGASVTNGQPLDVDMGSAVQGNNLVFTFAIENLGTSVLTINSITPGASEFIIGSAPTSVAVGNTETFTVTLVGTNSGTFSTIIEIDNDDSDESPFSFGVSGEITTPEISVYQGSDNTGTAIASAQTGNVDFGSATIASDISLTFAIQNSGTSVLNIGSITSSAAEYTITSVPSSVGVGATEIFHITLDGTNAGTFLSTITINNDDSDESTFTFPVTGEIITASAPEIAVWVGAITPGSEVTSGQSVQIDLGKGLLGNNVTVPFFIENTGDAQLNITNITSGSFKFTIAGAPVTVAAGGNETFDVVLDGSVVGIFNGTIVIANDDSDEGSFTFPVSGQITEPEIEVYLGADNTGTLLIDDDTGVEIEMGTIVKGVTNGSLTFAIENVGTSLLTISGISSSDSKFSIISAPSSVGEGATEQFFVELDASVAGSYTSTISIANDDLDENPFTFVVSGVVSNEELIVMDDNVNVTIGTTVSLGQTDLDEAVQRTFVIQNPSSATTLTINEVVISNSAFNVVSAPTSIAPAGSDDLIIGLDASSAGVFNGSVTITSNFVTFDFQVSGEVIEEIDTSIKVFNVVTPNGDGRHDYLKIDRITEHPGNRVTIFDRWGKKVYQGDDYDNSSVKFEGMNTEGNGAMLPPGTYYYVIVTGSEKTTGFIQISTNQ